MQVCHFGAGEVREKLQMHPERYYAKPFLMLWLRAYVSMALAALS